MFPSVFYLICLQMQLRTLFENCINFVTANMDEFVVTRMTGKLPVQVMGSESKNTSVRSGQFIDPREI
jgi:hypothetical protein